MALAHVPNNGPTKIERIVFSDAGTLQKELFNIGGMAPTEGIRLVVVPALVSLQDQITDMRNNLVKMERRDRVRIGDLEHLVENE